MRPVPDWRKKQLVEKARQDRERKQDPRLKLRPGNYFRLSKKKRLYCDILIENDIDPSTVMEKNWLTLARELNPQLCPIEKLSESPIEEVLAEELTRQGVEYVQQKWINISKNKNYRADFFIEPNIVVEADGWKYHGEYKNWLYDYEKTMALMVEGYTVLRFPGRNIQTNVRGVVKRIKIFIKRATPMARLGLE